MCSREINDVFSLFQQELPALHAGLRKSQNIILGRFCCKVKLKIREAGNAGKKEQGHDLI